mgnify:FL=1
MATTVEVRRCTRIRSEPLRTDMFADYSPANRKATVPPQPEARQRLDINVRKRPDSSRLRCHAWSASEEEHAGFGQ